MSITFPNTPNVGDEYTAQNGFLYKWDGEKWYTLPLPVPNDLPVGGATSQVLTKVNNDDYNVEWADTGAVTYTGPVPPESPQDGQLWWRDDQGILYIYYRDGDSVQWVQASTGVVYDATNLTTTDLAVTVQPYDATTLVGTDIGTTVQPYDATTLVGTDIGTTVQPYDATTLVGSDIGTTVEAFDSAIVKDDENQVFTKAQRGSVTTLTDAANISIDLNESNFYSLTLGGSRTLDNPTNATPGQSGCIFITQGGAGSNTLTFGTNYKFADGAAPFLTDDLGAVDVLSYVVRTNTSIICSVSNNFL